MVTTSSLQELGQAEAEQIWEHVPHGQPLLSSADAVHWNHPRVPDLLLLPTEGRNLDLSATPVSVKCW